jgi:hypothetical protein
MLLQWRNNDYEFNVRKMYGGKDKYSHHSSIDGLIFGADTESVQIGEKYEPQCFTLSSVLDDHIQYVPNDDYVLKTFIDYFLKEYGKRCLDHPVKHHLLYFHNLAYDWLQLIKQDKKLLEMAKVGVSPSEQIKLFRIAEWNVYLDKNAIFTGSSPNMRILCVKGETKFSDNHFFIHIHDTFSFFPSSLEKLGKELQLEETKLERQDDLGFKDWRVDVVSSEQKTYFETYAKLDSKITRLAGEEIRNLHRSAGMTKIRASSPSYAINLLYHGMTEEQCIVSGTSDPVIMQLVLDTYRGGRTGGVYHGQVDNISVYDFHSSYPASMLSLPSFNENMAYVNVEELDMETVMSILEETGNAFLRVSGTETDSRYPSLLTTIKGKLTPVQGDFENIATTGYEFLVGVKSGGLQNITVHEMVVLIDMDDEPFLPFKEFANTNYQRKAQAQKGSTEYASAKLGLNASYGKLIESRSQSLIGLEHGYDMLPYIEGMEQEFATFYYTSYLTMLEEGGDYEDWYNDRLDEIQQNFDEQTIQDMKYSHLQDFNISGNIYGRYVVPAGASLITGTSRARLLMAMKCLNALYWDTDSVFIEGTFTDEEINEKLKRCSDWLPSNVVPVIVGDELGMLDCEMKNGKGYLAGTKRYYLQQFNEDGTPTLDKKGNEIKKVATHGIPALGKDRAGDVIKNLATGFNAFYESKPKPMKAKESKSKDEIGSFKSKSYEPKFQLDERLEWTKTKTGWIGNVKPYQLQLTDEQRQEQEYEQIRNQYKGKLIT